MTETKAVLDGKMNNEMLGGLQRKYNEITRRVNEKTLDYDEVLEKLQLIVEDGPIVVSDQPTEKFGLLVDLGVIEVPADYDHATQLASFRKKNYKEFYSYNDAITDQNFSNPSRILKPGDKLLVRAFKQIVPDVTASEERMAFLETQGAVYTGAQGASILWDQRHDQLPKNKWYYSLDKKERLFKDAGDDHRVPSLGISFDGDFRFNLARFSNAWDERHIILCFSDLSEPSEA